MRITTLDKAVFLLCKGKELTGVEEDKEKPNRKIFVFNDTEGCKELIRQYDFAPKDSDVLLVNSKEYVYNLKKLKGIIYDKS